MLFGAPGLVPPYGESGGTRRGVSRRPAAARVAAIVALAAAAGIFLYVFLRAVDMPITIDEALTYLDHLKAPFRTMLSPAHMQVGMPANHLLNSILSRWSVKAMGPSEFALRMPNVLASAGYLVFGWLTLRRLAPPLVALAAFPLLFGNLYVLDFFSLCRGYGLSVAFLTVGVYLALRSLDDAPGGAASAAGSFLAFALATLASFPLASTLVVAAVGIAFYRAWRNVSGGRHDAASAIVRETAPAALACAATAAIVVPHFVRLRRLHLLYFGGTRGFVADTLGSLIERSLYGLPYAETLKPWVAGAVIAAFVGINVLALRRPSKESRAFLASVVLLDGTVAASLAAHAIFWSRYLLSRAAIFYVPLFVFVFTGAAGRLCCSRRPNVRRAAAAAAVLLGASAAFVFARGANLREPLGWRADMSTPAMIADLIRQPALPRPLSLAVPNQRGAAIVFYREVDGAEWFVIDDRLRERWTTAADFVYLTPPLRARAESLGFQRIREYPLTGNVLMARPGPERRTSP